MYSPNGFDYDYDEYGSSNQNNGIILLGFNNKTLVLNIPDSIDGKKVECVQFIDSLYHIDVVTLPKNFALDIANCGDWIRDVKTIKMSDGCKLTNSYNYKVRKIIDNPDSSYFKNLREVYNYSGTYGGSVFKNSKNLKALTLSPSYTQGTGFDFFNCKKLSTVVIPEGVQYVGNYAFMNTGLKSVDIPSSVNEIGVMAFGFMDAKIEWDINYGKTNVMNVTATKIPRFVINGACNSEAAYYAAEYDITFNATDATFIYEILSDNTCRIVQYNGNAKVVVVPHKINGLNVVEIDSTTFANSQPEEVWCLPKGLRIKEYDYMTAMYPAQNFWYYIENGKAIPCSVERHRAIQTVSGKTYSPGYMNYTPLPATIDGLPIDDIKHEQQHGDFVYTINPGGKTCTITCCTAHKNSVEIPSKINGYTVTELGSGALKIHKGDKSLISIVTIPPSVEYISEDAFYLDYQHTKIIYEGYHEPYYYEEDYDEDRDEKNPDPRYANYDSDDDLTFCVEKGSYAEKYALRHRRSIIYTTTKNTK